MPDKPLIEDSIDVFIKESSPSYKLNGIRNKYRSLSTKKTHIGIANQISSRY
jgi:hypothetical protein